MTHPGILKINELFNNKLSKEISNIKITADYIGNFGNANLFNAIREELVRVGYNDINGQLDTLFCIIDSIKHDQVKISTIKNVEVKTIFNAFSKLLSFGKVSFDSRVRRDLLMCIYLDNEHVHFETNFLKLDQHKQIANEFISILVKKGLFIQKTIRCRIETSDLYQQIYDNAKSVITNMYSRGISVFAIACYFWFKNQDFIPKSLLYNWSNSNFIEALMTTPLYESTASQEIKDRLNELDKEFTFWTVLSEISLLTGKVQNINKQRKELNSIIN
ncbi:MAG: hypothetical protein IJH34_10785, partial [Romboutsia sp.]|nr:hypothetical protein [Romboutsia sp.]